MRNSFFVRNMQLTFYALLTLALVSNSCGAYNNVNNYGLAQDDKSNNADTMEEMFLEYQ